jgi:hypothetical protein
MTLPAIFAILVGMMMIGQWIMLFVTRQIAELETEPFRIWFHIAGEIVTAVLLIAGGAGLLLSLPWSIALYLVAMGMLLYTAIVSPGYFAQKGQWVWVLFFAVLVVLTILSAVAVGGRSIG